MTRNHKFCVLDGRDKKLFDRYGREPRPEARRTRYINLIRAWDRNYELYAAAEEKNDAENS